MINFGLGSFLTGLEYLEYELGNAQAAAPDMIVPEAQHQRVKNNIEMITRECCARLSLEETTHTCLRLEALFNRYEYVEYTYRTLADELTRLYEDIKRGASQQYFFHYPDHLQPLAQDGVGGMGGPGGTWVVVIDAFSSSKREIETGIDCYVLGDYSGCVFHMMRIAELGLRTVAKERGIKTLTGKRGPMPVQWGTWEQVFNAIEAQLKGVRQAVPGPKRDAALTFYNTVLSDLQTLRNLYRDPTMHFRDNYDAGEAYSSVSRVHSLMRTLATKLREDRIRKIAWGL